MEQWYTYIIHSEKINKYYVGSTSNIELRVQRHNLGWGKFTKKGIPWKLVYFEIFSDKSDSLRREKEIKSKKSRTFIIKLISGAGGRPE